MAQPREVWLGALGLLAGRLQNGVQRQLEQRAQRLDRPAHGAGAALRAWWRRSTSACAQLAQRMRQAVLLKLQRLAHN